MEKDAKSQLLRNQPVMSVPFSKCFPRREKDSEKRKKVRGNPKSDGKFRNPGFWRKPLHLPPMVCTYYSYNLPFRHPFTISRGTKTHQPTLIVELEHKGLRGYGEAPAISYYNIPVDQMIADLEAKKAMIEKFALTDPQRYWHYLHHLIPNNSFLVCALDIAAWDLFGKIVGKPLFGLWGLDPTKGPATDFTIGIDTVEKMVAKMQEKPWPIYKIKLGGPDDLAVMEALRQHTDAVFRVDANGYPA